MHPTKRNPWRALLCGVGICCVAFTTACRRVDPPENWTETSKSASEEKKRDGGDPSSAPVALVTAFFEAMEKDDRTTMETLMTPERAKRMEENALWDSWLSLWKKYKVVRIGEVLTELGSNGEWPDKVNVRVEYRQDEREITDSVTVTRIDDRWYWDEN